MFESLVANLLNRFLGAYLENFDSKQLNIGIWGGDVKLTNLRLKKESLDKFKLPIDVKFGHLGVLTLQIPWSNLKGKPVQIIIEDLYLLAVPIILQNYDADEDERRKQAVKQDKLKELEFVLQTKSQELGKEDLANETFTESLMTKIVDNLQVTIKNIHIRYEDKSVLTETPYTFGASLKELSAVSTDENWQPSFISITQAFTRKLLKLDSLSCYMDTQSPNLFSELNNDQLLDCFNSATTSSEYLVKPVTGNGKLTVHKAGTTKTTPHINSDLCFDEFGLELNTQQYQNILWTASKFHWYIKTEKFRRLRPKQPPSEAPREWFKYAAQCILNEIHENNYKWSWEYMEKRRDQRLLYIKLWMLKLSKNLGELEQKELEKLEWDLPFEDIKFYRALARNKIRKENSQIALYDTNKAAQKNENQNNKGWLSGWWSGSTSYAQESEKKQTLEADGSDAVTELSLSDEQKKELYNTIDYDEQAQVSVIDLPKDYVKVRVSTFLKRGGLVIRKNDANELAEVIFEGCKTQFFQRPDSFLAGFQMQEFRIEDGTGSSIYKHMVSVKQAAELNQQNEKDSNSPFFQAQYEQNPLDGTADSSLSAQLKSMTIFYNPKFIEEIIVFFTPPKIHLDTIGAIMNAAEASIEGLTARTRMGLEYVLEEHKTINLKLDLQAPLIIVPLDPSSFKSPVAILDAGHISVISNLVERSKIKEYKEKEKYTDEDWKNLQNLLYDKFNVYLNDIEFYVGNTIKSTMEQLYADEDSRPARMLNNLSLQFSLGISILPDAQNLPKIKAGGNVPKVSIAMNDFQYKTILEIMDAMVAVLPDVTSDIPDDNSSVFNAYGNYQQNDGVDVEKTTQLTKKEDNDNDVDKDKDKGKGKGKDKDKDKDKNKAEEQRLFESEFCIDTIELAISRCIDGVSLKDEPLIGLTGDALQLHLFKTETDLHLTLSLLDMSVFDRMETSGVEEFKKLMSSDIEGENDRKLLALSLVRKQRVVEFNNKQIEVFDQEIDLQIATVKFVLTRKTILDFITFSMNTFTDPNAKPTPADALNHNTGEIEELTPQKINMKIKLDSIIMILNEDGLKLATLELDSANIDLFLLPESIDVQGNLGALTLKDDIIGDTLKNSTWRNLIHMDGDNLAEFSYKTFDIQSGRPSEVEFRTGSLSITFIESSVNRILEFLSQFMKMKAIYDSAREAAMNQATQLPARVKFDILVRAPTIIFPFIDKGNDKIVANLGEIYARNEYKDEINAITSGIRKVSLVSSFYFDNVEQHLSIVENLDIVFNADWSENYVQGVPTFEIQGKMPELEISLTEMQIKLLSELSTSIGDAFTFDTSEQDLKDIQEDAQFANEVLKHNTNKVNPQQKQIIQTTNSTGKPPLLLPPSSSPPPPSEVQIPSDHIMVDLKFTVPLLALTLYNKTLGSKDVSELSLSKFSLNGLNINFVSDQSTHFKSDLKITSFVVEDVRKHTQSKFLTLIPAVEGVKDQFVLSANSSGDPEDKNITILLTVEKPTAVLALDYLFELQAFFEHSMSPQRPELTPRNSRKSVVSISQGSKKPLVNEVASTTSKVGFSINVTKPSVFLLADDSKEDTEAVVFKIEQILITKQNIISLAMSNIGMYLTRMDDPRNASYRIIDDFSVSFAYDDRGSTPAKSRARVQASVEALILRVSLRDIRLGYATVQRANDLFAKHQDLKTNRDGTFVDNFKKKVSEYAPSIISSMSEETDNVVATGDGGGDEEGKSVEVDKGDEELTASVGGLRFVLIGAVSELPVLDMNLEPFELKALNWSTDLSAELHIETFVNIFNYANSCWQPLLEPWPVSIYASKLQDPESKLQVETVSRQLAQITITSRSVALLSQTQTLLSMDEKLKPRGQDYPFVIVNDTGLDLTIWTNGNEEATKTEINDQERKPWTFEDWRTIRENLDADTASTLGLAFKNNDYEKISAISAARVGEELYVLNPPVNGVHNRLAVNIQLRDDNVKVINIRSTVLIENDADIPIAVATFDEKDSIIHIESKKSRAVPINLVYEGKLRIKPQLHTSFGWSEESIGWKDLMKKPMSLRCPSKSKQDSSVYYFQIEAAFDRDETLARIYPHFNLIVSAPLEIENLLPYDFKYRLYDKNSRKEWAGSVKKGVNSYVHVVSLDNLLLLSVEPENCGYNKSEFAIINGTKTSEFTREQTMVLRGKNSNTLRLNIHYPKKQADSTSLKVVVYSPYVILNRSNLNIFANERGNIFESPSRASDGRENYPTMFSFDKFGDRKNRATIKADDTVWSLPVSFDAIGQSNQVKLQLLGQQKEINLGISISEGEGKYNLTKTVTVAPRYVLINRLDMGLGVVEEGSTQSINVDMGALLPLYGLRCLDKTNLLLRLRNSSKWCQPFCIDDVGQLFVKVQNSDERQILLKVTMLLEEATMFIHVENANNQWPFAIKNYTNEEFYVYQNDPNINADGEVVKNDTPYKPIYYQVPPKSIMPYAYDYPNAIVKELIVRSHGRERSVNLSEIGNLRPFRLPPASGKSQVVIDLNVCADGPTQTLVITDYDPSKSIYSIAEETASGASLSKSQSHFEAAKIEENYTTKIVTKFDGIGISLINTNEEELCYITIKGLEFRYNESNIYQTYSMKLKWIQIDNQLHGAMFPIVLYPSVVPKTGEELNEHPALSASVCRVKDDTHGVLFIKYATILLQEMTFDIGEDFLYALIDFAKFPGASWNKQQIDRLCEDSLDIPEPLKLNDTRDIYFEALHLQPIQANISFVRTDTTEVEDKTTAQNALMFCFNVLTMAMGNISDAPIKLNALFIENIRVPTPILVDSIQTHYKQAFFYQLHNIVGSADFLGNPVGLFNLLSSGVIDIFYEPYQGFVLNDRPQELGIGLAKGGLSFVKKTVFGFSDSFSKITGSLAKGLSVATMDPKFQERRRLQMKRNRVNHFAGGANSFFESLTSGIGGIAVDPIEGASVGGTAGFFKGLGKGMIGLPTKTAIGLFDFASNVSEGIRNSATVFDGEALDRARLPRYINPDGVIKPYSEREAQGQYWLYTIDEGAFYKERYLAHLLLPGDEMVVLVTYRQIILFDIRSLRSRWIINFDQIKSISVASAGLTIELKNRNGPFIPIPDRNNRTFLYQKIGIAVKEYNKKCRVAL
ncbi:VPS13 [Candida oxycetoniae]|uniref:Vacuolar protein sorting-associated protein n=1 Tax=Candida oxycetoniae TaxID=497107 RepID=A0AAI9SYN3_9ASCO|nr:VPS13 [Candida oxycetoniae]KAI3405553.2 VPS13 [Candida oxycetoniae]